MTMPWLWRMSLWLRRHLCWECRGWRWRIDHRYGHAKCVHEARLALWIRGRDEFGYDVSFAPCVECGANL